MKKRDNKRNALVITKRGKRGSRLVPVEQPVGPFRGCMKGTVKILGDLTEPIDIAWDTLADRRTSTDGPIR
jgi:hypothetical protein